MQQVARYEEIVNHVSGLIIRATEYKKLIWYNDA